uniref:Uncharacterized protein n=1 Tax=Arundo donax TaxID=35708 RepID=A0A0A9EQA7_ARUDO
MDRLAVSTRRRAWICRAKLGGVGVGDSELDGGAR